MNELETARNEISRIDKEMAALFEQRMHAAAVIAPGDSGADIVFPHFTLVISLGEGSFLSLIFV